MGGGQRGRSMGFKVYESLVLADAGGQRKYHGLTQDDEDREHFNTED